MTAVPISEIEPFVDVDTAAEFLVITRRHLLELARAGEIPAHPIGGGRRKTWRFRLSEIADAISTENRTSTAPKPDIIGVGSPRSRKEQSHG
jgi:excisionase family DNA binding protein